MSLIPASITLAKAEVSLVPRWNSVNVLKGKLRNYLKTMNKRLIVRLNQMRLLKIENVG